MSDADDIEDGIWDDAVRRASAFMASPRGSDMGEVAATFLCYRIMQLDERPGGRQAAERDACAHVCDLYSDELLGLDPPDHVGATLARHLADKIRGRSS